MVYKLFTKKENTHTQSYQEIKFLKMFKICKDAINLQEIFFFQVEK